MESHTGGHSVIMVNNHRDHMETDTRGHSVIITNITGTTWNPIHMATV